MVLSITFNLVSKLRSCPVAATTDIVLRRFILTIPDVEEIAVAVIAEEELRVTRVLQLSVVIWTVACLVIGGKMGGIMSLIS